MLTAIHPKIPMRNKNITRKFYTEKLGFEERGNVEFDGYLILKKDQIELHFFEFRTIANSSKVIVPFYFILVVMKL